MIKLEDVSFSYEDREILDDINLNISKGDYVGIIGENGSGKTTLLSLLLKLKKPTKGTLENSFKSISYISQIGQKDINTFPCTVYEFVSLGIEHRLFHFLTKEQKKKIDDILEEMGVTASKNKRLSELSGGQLQRVRLAKALINKPDIIFLDEPTSGLDLNSKVFINNKLHILNHHEGVTVVIVSHIEEDLLYVKNLYQLKEQKLVKVIK